MTAHDNISPIQLIVRLTIYFAILIAAITLLIGSDSGILRYLPIGGANILDISDIEVSRQITDIDSEKSTDEEAQQPKVPVSQGNVTHFALFLSAHLTATIVVMLPITWTYSATRYEAGPPKVFVQTLLVLPLCAATVVLLVQDSLALAFGLAALVAAVRFRMDLPETIDGIYIFAAICVGLAAGIGYIGASIILAIFFCMTSAVLWAVDYGRNPIDDARQSAKQAKFTAKSKDPIAFGPNREST